MLAKCGLGTKHRVSVHLGDCRAIRGLHLAAEQLGGRGNGCPLSQNQTPQMMSQKLNDWDWLKKSGRKIIDILRILGAKESGVQDERQQRMTIRTEMEMIKHERDSGLVETRRLKGEKAQRDTQSWSESRGQSTIEG